MVRPNESTVIYPLQAFHSDLIAVGVQVWPEVAGGATGQRQGAAGAPE